MRRIVFTTLALLALALPAAAHAQDDSTTERRPARPRDRDGDCRCGLREVRDDDGGPSRRRGLWFSAGLGAGSESFDANDGLGWSDDQGGGMVFLKLGGTVSRSFLLGVELSGWARTYRYEGYDRSLGTLMAVGQWYPARNSGLWLKGGLGFAADVYDEYGPGGRTITENGSAVSIGLGYDIPVGRRASITPLVDIQRHHYDTHDERVVGIGVGITLH